MTDEFRVLCAELVELCTPVDSIPQLAERLQKLNALADRARALLAQPEPEGPSDDELDELFTEIDQSGEALSWRAYARAVLARWGRPAAAPVPEPGEVAELVEWLGNPMLVSYSLAASDSASRRLIRAAELLGRPTPQPPADGEVAELVEWLHRRAAEVQAENCTTIYSPHLLRRVADLLGQTEPERSASMMYYARQCNTQAVAALVALEVLADAADQFGPAGGADGKALAAEVKKARGVLARTLLAEADGPAVPNDREPASVATQPSDAEIMELMPQQMHDDLAAAVRAMAEQEGIDSTPAKGVLRIILNRHVVDLARAVLAKWGRPTPQPVALFDIGQEWRPCVKLPITVHVRDQRPGETHSSTREGITPLRSDDLIMRGVRGEEYPIGRDLFEQTYELLPTPKATND